MLNKTLFCATAVLPMRIPFGNRNFESSQTKQQTPEMEQIENGSFFRSL